MSRLFGEMRQIAFVVRDIKRAVHHWTGILGVGPFFMLWDITPADWLYRGEASPPPRLTIALGYSGEFQVELIQQHDEHPSGYRDLLLSGREGFHHVSSWLTRAGYEQTVADLAARGLVPIHQGALPGAGIRFAYFDTDAAAPGGFYFEIAEVMEPPFYEGMMRLREAARNWDGTNPILERL